MLNRIHNNTLKSVIHCQSIDVLWYSKSKTRSTEEWKVVTSAISTLVDEATFEANVEGISFRGMDPSHVALIDIHWPNSTFESFECDSAIKFGVRIDELLKVIRRGDKKDSVEISLGDDSTLLIKMFNGYLREYKMRLIESSASATPLPKLSFNTKVVLVAGSFDRILSDINIVSEYLSIKSESSAVHFSGKGDSGEAEIILDPKSEGLEELIVKEQSIATYSIDYLSKITKAISTVGGSIVRNSQVKCLSD